MQDLSIALIQTDLHWEQVDANLAMFEEMIWSMDADVDLILLPEMFTTGFSMNAEKLAESPGGKTFRWMRQMAKVKDAAMAGSCMIKEKSHFYNRLYFVYPDGSAAHYDKKHLFTLAGEHKVYTPGKERKIIEFRGWRIKPLICYELRFPVWGRSEKKEDRDYQYDLLIYAANWPDARIGAWDTLLKARAIENLSYVAGINRTGMDGYPKEYPGHSSVYGYDGEQLAFSDKKEEILYVNLSSENQHQFRKRFNFQYDADSFILK
ncbi:MAG: amidohydrolase [Ekhidna sp.]|nr:amidohydrolase [Ekhidna sp.]